MKCIRKYVLNLTFVNKRRSVNTNNFVRTIQIFFVVYIHDFLGFQ